MQKIIQAVLLAMTLGCLGPVSAAELTPAEKAPAPPPLPEGEVPEAVPEVRIIRTPQGVVSEYRVGGQLYMVRIQPRVGPPYFLVDTDGDGNLDTRRHSLENIQPPQWVLFSW